MSKEETHEVPKSARFLENIHIIFWLIKDLCWAMLWKPLGLFMIIPTLLAGFIITYQTRKIRSELFHNSAVVLWIIANTYWMVTEFFFDDDKLRIYASIPFSLGLVLLAYYYLDLFIQNRSAKVKSK